MEIKDIANKLACSGSTGGANTGKLGCLSLFGTPTHLLRFEKGLLIPGATEFNLAYLKPLVQKGRVTPIMDASAFEDVSGADAYSTNTSGVKRINLKGLPEYKLMFEEGHEFYRQMAKLEGFKSHVFVIGDDEGNWMLVERSDDNYIGFSAGHVTPELTKRKVKGGDAESKSILIQFLDRLEWDHNYVILHREELTFTPSEVPTINGLEINFTAIPAAAETTLTANVVLSADNNTQVEGILVDGFQYKVDGVVTPITSVTEAGGIYTFTVPALLAGEVVSLETWDDTLKTHAIDSNDVLYRSDLETVTVLA